MCAAELAVMAAIEQVGGGEWFQLYHYDMSSGKSMLLTDGRSRNLFGCFSTLHDRVAYTSTQRTGKV